MLKDTSLLKSYFTVWGLKQFHVFSYFMLSIFPVSPASLAFIQLCVCFMNLNVMDSDLWLYFTLFDIKNPVNSDTHKLP